MNGGSTKQNKAAMSKNELTEWKKSKVLVTIFGVPRGTMGAPKKEEPGKWCASQTVSMDE